MLAGCLCDLFGNTSDTAYAGAQILAESLITYLVQHTKQ